MKKKYQSFSKRLTRRIVLAVTFTMIVITAFILFVVGRAMNEKNRNYFQSLMDVENETVEKVLFGVEITIHRSTKPLYFLAKSADKVAKGNLDTPLPVIKHNDEVRLLRDSFGNMQQSLDRYIELLKATTAQKASIESEFNIARDILMSMLPCEFLKTEGHP